MERMNDLILVPTDFSEVCNNATEQAAKAAKFFDYKMVLLHVLDKNSLGKLEIETKLANLSANKSKEYGIEIDTEVIEGDIFSVIPDRAKDLGAKLMFLGTHGKVGMQKLTGSFALKVIISSPCPVVVNQKRPFDGGYKKIVLPITSDAGPVDKTKWAIFFAKTFGAEVHIAHPEKDELIGVIRMLTQNLALAEIKYMVHPIASSSFTEKLMDMATSIDADLTMIMTKPSKEVKDFIFGRYDEEIIFNKAQIPVMCINPRPYNWEKIFDF
jgi:nucleotide-binding universal stress UspA family protein